VDEFKSVARVGFEDRIERHQSEEDKRCFQRATHDECGKCGEWKPNDKFYRLRDWLRKPAICLKCIERERSAVEREERKRRRKRETLRRRNYKETAADRRDITQKQATPSWVNMQAIKRIYKKAAEISQETGVQHHVDHIVPLQADGVRGLHVPWNLQIITAEQNLAKGNALISLDTDFFWS